MRNNHLHCWLQLLGREFKLFWSNKVFVVAFLVMPFILAGVQGLVYQRGKVKKQKIIVVDLDHSPASDRFKDMLEDNPTLNVEKVLFQTTDLQQTRLDDRAVAVVLIPFNFEAHLLSGKHPEINCYLNMSNTISSGAVGAAVNACATTMNVGLLVSSMEKKGMPQSSALLQYESFKSNIFLKNNTAGNYLYFLWPGLIFSTLHQLLLLALAVSFSREMAEGTFTPQGLLAYSSHPIVLELVKIIPYLLMALYISTIYYGLSVYFKVPLPAHPSILLLSQFLMVLGAACLSTFYSLLIPLPLKASQMLMSVASPAFTLSGFTWPSEQAPIVLANIGKIIPLSPFVRVLRMTLWEKASWVDVRPHIYHQLLLVIIYFGLSIWVLQKKIKKAKAPSVGNNVSLVNNRS